MPDLARVSLARRLLARWWYVWGLSLCYWGSRTHEPSFFRAGANAFGRATRWRPNLAQAYYQRGAVRGRELGEYEAAIADLTRAVELDPEWPEPYLQRGLHYRFNGDVEAAKSDLARYLELAPEGSWRDEAVRQLAALEGDGEPMV